MRSSWILNNKRQRKLSERRRFKINQQVELMRHLETEVWDLFSFMFIVLYGLHIYARALWKATFRKQIKEICHLFLLSSLFCLNENPKAVRFAMSHFLWIMKCNLREQMPNQVSFWKKSRCFLRRISRPKLSSHNLWSARLKTYKVFFEFFWPVISYFLMHPSYFGLCLCYG